MGLPGPEALALKILSRRATPRAKALTRMFWL
jgi:hypothetical protein